MKPGLFNMLMECQIQSGLCVAVGGWGWVAFGRGWGGVVIKQTRVTTRPGQESSPSTAMLLFTCWCEEEAIEGFWPLGAEFSMHSKSSYMEKKDYHKTNASI